MILKLSSISEGPYQFQIHISIYTPIKLGEQFVDRVTIAAENDGKFNT